MVYFTDHMKYDPNDELGDYLGIRMAGIGRGLISDMKPHTITKNITSLEYLAGAVLVDYEYNPDIEILGRLRAEDYADLNMNDTRDPDEPSAPPVMGILHYPRSRIFFIGDMNGIQVIPQPFIDNLISWMGECEF